MGGHGSGRLNKTDTFLRGRSDPFKSVGNLAQIGNEVLVLPNHSGIKSFVDNTKTIFLKRVTRLISATIITSEMEIIFCNTDSAGYEVTLPAGIEGATYKIINSGSTGNILTVAPNGSEDLLGENSSFTLNDAESLLLTFDTTDGWY